MTNVTIPPSPPLHQQPRNKTKTPLPFPLLLFCRTASPASPKLLKMELEHVNFPLLFPSSEALKKA